MNQSDIDAVLALANHPLAKDLTDEITKELSDLVISPNDRKAAMVELKALRRDICLLAIGIEQLIELEMENLEEIKGLRRDVLITQNGIIHYMDDRKKIEELEKKVAAL